MRKINYSKVRRSAQEDLKKYERFGIKVFKAALKLQAKPNPSPLPMQEAYITFYQKVFVDSAKKEFDRIRQDNREKAFVPSDFFLNTWREWIKDWVLQNLGTLIAGVNNTTLEQIQKILGEGLEEGLNPFQLERLLLKEIPNVARARAIARTESTRAYNEGKKRSADDWAKQTGTQLWKLWIHGGAREPRFQHIQAQDKPIRADQPFVFTTKGVEVFMDKPGDQKGGAAQTVNCSCVVVYVSEAYARRNFPNTFIGLPPLIRPTNTLTTQTITIEAPTQLQGFRYANTFDEAKEISKNIINQNTVLKVDSTKFGSNLSLSQLNRYNEQINKLSLEYNLAPYLDETSQISLQFASSNKYFGFVQPAYNKIQTINFGDKYDKVSRTIPRVEINQFGGKRFAGKSKVDSENVEISTLTHEFAHVIAIESAGNYSKYPQVAMFWKELKSLMTKYRKDVKAKVSTNDWVGLDQIFLGDYANTNRNEFMAEGFTEYKLSSNPSKYAIEIGKLIDKYFKK
jgi:hypothetical protein